ncbi:hypothetical protein F2Q70_00016642 [Brassica cretica]|uniref:Uncharacterized protein n=1 Tax=Brassica cretica TaxID=69181 RepID=A0A8S9KU54_BRACR|nr:hypothetical protein F2Q70_00016642 [Brassica cretica]KAF2596746.1 hypothetical protein F2Q68_00009607 [Brassica cretica]
MEEAMAEHIQNTQEVAHEAEKKGNDQQEVNYINRHGHKTGLWVRIRTRTSKNHKQSASCSCCRESPPGELKCLGMMMPTAVAGLVGSGQCVQSGYHEYQYQDGQHVHLAEYQI